MPNIDPKLENLLRKAINVAKDIESYLNASQPSTEIIKPRQRIYDFISSDKIINVESVQVARSSTTWPGIRLLGQYRFKDMSQCIAITDIREILENVRQDQFHWVIKDCLDGISIRIIGRFGNITDKGNEITIHNGECLLIIGDYSNLESCFDFSSKIWFVTVKTEHCDHIIKSLSTGGGINAENQPKQDNVSDSAR